MFDFRMKIWSGLRPPRHIKKLHTGQLGDDQFYSSNKPQMLHSYFVICACKVFGYILLHKVKPWGFTIWNKIYPTNLTNRTDDKQDLSFWFQCATLLCAEKLFKF